MKNISFFNEKNSYALANLTFMDSKPLTDSKILDLQEKFLTNGIHHITVPTINDGRTFVFTFLHSLSFFLHSVGCVTASDLALPDMITDVQGQLAKAGIAHASASDYMHTYLFEHFDFDFAWVELTSELVASPWYLDFEKNLLDLNMDKNMPMLVITYTNDQCIKSNLI